MKRWYQRNDEGFISLATATPPPYFNNVPVVAEQRHYYADCLKKTEQPGSTAPQPIHVGTRT
ncbi:hypothetical protein [Hymenobacter negativus]|uniref:hypothetical protein n=1 Tax=Hymenobacter negativus TaxID=2795026 RepID=UPI001AAF9AC7|nr:hypothetical protein [Hymenobacter negativus]